MGKEINLMEKYPRSKRNIQDRGNTKTDEDRLIARKFDKDFFDGDRKHGYGGFSYNERFWKPVIPDFAQYYGIKDGSSILDVGCAKGFMLYDYLQFNDNLTIKGIDISNYAVTHSKEEVKQFLEVGNAKNLPYQDNSFDLAIAVTTIHNLEREECAQALLELQRVSKNCFVTLDAYRNDEEKARMEAWNLTAKTVMHVDEWKVFFKEIGYNGDYYWFIP